MNDPANAFLQMVGGGWSPINDPLTKWTSCYNAIFNINKFLTFAPTMEFSWTSAKDDSTYRKRSIAEAYGLRAYYHFQLLRYYGGNGVNGKMLGVPYMNQVLDLNPTIWANVVRPDYKSTVDSIAKDLTFAANNLPVTYTGTDRVLGATNVNRLTSLIANALKAELYLHVASPKYNGGTYNTAYCDSALKYSSILITKIGGLTAFTGVLKSTLFYTTDANQELSDVLWKMSKTAAATDASTMAQTIEAKNYPPSLSGKGQVNPTQDFVDAFPTINGYPITDVTNSKYNAALPYTSRDPRLDACVIRDGATFKSTVISTAKSDTKNGIENPGATRTGYYLKKLLRPDVSITNPITGNSNVRPLIRYTEMYLIFAEAATAAHGADWKTTYAYSARDIILAIRKRGGITGVSSVDTYAKNLATGNFMDLVRNERRIELAFEGFRFSDLRRWGLEVNNKVSKARVLTTGAAPAFMLLDDEPRNFSTYKYYAPIPNSEMLKCPNLIQNGSN